MAIEFNCPECSALIRVPDNASGKKGSCPSCKVKLRVPKVDIPDPNVAPPISPSAPVAPQPPAPQPPAPQPPVEQPSPPAPESAPSDETIPPRPGFMSPRPPAEVPPPAAQTSVPVTPNFPDPAAPPGPPGFPQAPAPGAPQFPQAPASPAAGPQFPGAAQPPEPVPQQPGAPQFPGAPAPAQPQPGAPQIPGPPPGTVVPPVAPAQSVSRQARRLASRKKGGMVFPVICGLILAGGLGWMYLNLGPDIDGERVGYSQTGTMMRPVTVSPSLADLSPEIASTVLTYFEEDPETLRSQFVETRFSSAQGDLQVQILTGMETRFVRFPIDADLRSWYNSYDDELNEPRRENFSKSLTSFFKDWDVAIRNQSGVENPLKYRDDVGLTACVGGLGYHVEALVGSTPMRCVYEDDGNLFFLIPANQSKFKIVGRSLRKNAPPVFPGEYEVTIVPDKKKSSSVTTEDGE